MGHKISQKEATRKYKAPSTLDRDLSYLQQAYRAAAYSPDPSTQNGAILVDVAGTVLVVECNRFPNMVKETKKRWERPLKYQFVEHAERNVIYSAACQGIQTNGLTMYVCWFACADCARAIIQAGIKEVVGHDWEAHKTRPDWADSIKVGDQMFKEAGVKFRRVKGKIGSVRVRFNGEMLEP